MGKTKAVLLWPDSNKMSTDDYSVLNSEDRFVGAVSAIKFGNKLHKCIVKCISSDERKIAEAEAQVELEIEEAIKKQESDCSMLRHSRRRAAPTIAGVATQNQVAAAMGERLKATSQAQSAALKNISNAKKVADEAQRAAQDAIDRHLVAQGSRAAALNDKDDHSSLDGKDDCSEDETYDGDDDNGAMDRDCDAAIDSQSNSCCTHCLALQRAFKECPSYALALQSINEQAKGVKVSAVEYLDVLPVPQGVPKVELSKGSQVYVANADKNAIKREGDGDPAKLARLTLLYLFGRESLELNDVTARGLRKGAKGIPPVVLKAIKDFVNRNKSQQYNDLTSVSLNRIINKKKGQVHRTSKKTSKTGLSEAPRKTTTMSSRKSQKESKKSPCNRQPFPANEDGPKEDGPNVDLPSKHTSTSRRSPMKKVHTPLKRSSPLKPQSRLEQRQSPMKRKSPYKKTPTKSPARDLFGASTSMETSHATPSQVVGHHQWEWDTMSQPGSSSSGHPYTQGSNPPYYSGHFSPYYYGGPQEYYSQSGAPSQNNGWLVQSTDVLNLP